MDQIGGRKFVYIILVTLLAFYLVAFKIATAKEFFDFILGAALLFFGGNVAEKFVAKKTDDA